MKSYVADLQLYGTSVAVRDDVAGWSVQNRHWLRPVTDHTIPPAREFAWGDESIGGYLLAASILCDLVGPVDGLAHVNRFRREYIAALPPCAWTLNGDDIKRQLAVWSKEAQP